MSWIRSYSCSTAAGPTTDELWKALEEGRAPLSTSSRSLGCKAALWQSLDTDTIEDLLVLKLTEVFQTLPLKNIEGRVGVVFASAKGMLSDFVLKRDNDLNAGDPLTPVLNRFLHSHRIQAERNICVTHACSSALGALALAQKWLARGLDQVFILAADAVTPFVVSGFQSLGLISDDLTRPFANNRNGFHLGDAAAIIHLTRHYRPGDFKLHPVGLDSEGSVVTRPESSSSSLAAAIAPMLGLNTPNLIIAHGTATSINDATESLAFEKVFKKSPLITGIKWCVGHTLGASGALDLIVACESLRLQKTVTLKTTIQIDPKLKGQFAVEGGFPPVIRFVMTSSLGFGGMHAAALVEAMP